MLQTQLCCVCLKLVVSERDCGIFTRMLYLSEAVISFSLIFANFRLIALGGTKQTSMTNIRNNC